MTKPSFPHVPMLHRSEAFQFDAIAEAEAAGAGVGTALVLQMAKSRLTTQMAIDAGDSTFGDSLERHLAVATRIGFVPLVQIPFNDTDNPFNNSVQPEALHVLVHPETGILLSVESYTTSNRAPRVNTSRMLFVSKMSASGASGGWESPSNPDWRRDPFYAFSETRRYPEDMVFVGDFDTRECLASKFAEVLSCTPVPRPIHSCFEALDAVGHRQDYTDCCDPSTQRTDYMAVDPLRRQRLQELCASAGLNASLFGVSFA